MDTVSSLSVAVRGIAAFLSNKFAETNEPVSVSLHPPETVKESARTSDTHILNLFFYRISPSGFHAATTAEEANFVRLSALLTPFVGTGDDPQEDVVFKILGLAIRYLSEEPVVPTVLPGTSTGHDGDFREVEGCTTYQVQAVMQALSMEEINHIWTTQGGDTAYRLSAAFEFSLVPIEPLQRPTPPVPARTAILDLAPRPNEIDAASGLSRYSDDSHAIPLAGGDAGTLPTANWLPIILAVDGESLTTHPSVTSDESSLQIAVAGLPGARVVLETNWTRADGSSDSQSEIVEIAAARVDDPDSIVALTLENPTSGDQASIRVRIVDGTDQPLADQPATNSITLTVS